jgi:hypothetical protein
VQDILLDELVEQDDKASKDPIYELDKGEDADDVLIWGKWLPGCWWPAGKPHI